jgi:hypothetical protein
MTGAWEYLLVARESTPELRIELLENGLDELASAVEALQGPATPQS